MNRSGSTRTTGLLVAAGVALASAGILGTMILGSSPAKRAPQAGVGLPLKEPTQTGRGLRVEMADRSDASRRAMLIRSKTIEPLRGADYAVGEPSAWLYFRDGRSVYIRANEGHFTLPRQDQAPERGAFKGDVRVRLFSAEQGAPENPEGVAPSASFTLDQLDFDLTLGEAWTDAAFAGTLDATEFAGVGFRVVLDEPRQRIQKLTIARDLKVLVRESKGTVAGTSGAAGDAKSGSGIGAPAVETLYRLEGAGPVQLAGSGRFLDADRIEVFARLVDNKLRAGAIGELDLGGEPKRVATSEEPAGNTGAAPRAPSDKTVLLTVTAKGPVVLAPVSGAPELKSDDVYVRVHGTDRTLVFEDAASKAKATGAVMEYGATRRSVTVAGSASAPAVVSQAERGSLSGVRVSAELPAGVAQVRGAGELRDAAGRRSVAWTEQADFVFATERGVMTDRVKEVLITGNVVAKDRETGLSAGVVRAMFADDAAGRPQFSRVTAEDRVRVSDGKKSGAQADKLSATFKPGDAKGGTSQLASVTLAGNARASQDKTVLNASLIEADLGKGAKGETIATRVGASGNVKYDNGQGVLAQTERMTADPVARTVLLNGAGSSVAREQTKVTGTIIRLADAPGRMAVEGPGEFSHTGVAGKSGTKQVQSVSASWKSGMTYDDATGVLQCNGDVAAEMHPDADTTDRLAAGDLQLNLTPGSGVETPAGGKSAERSLVRALAHGVPGKDGTVRPVAIESRRYEPGSTGPNRKLVQLFYLEGPTVEADNAAGTLRVPTAGRLLELDRRDRAPVANLAAESPLAKAASDSRGKALFSWTGSMDFQRSSGLLSMNDGVNLTHERPDGLLTVMDCAKLEATVLTGNGTSPESGQLVSATASGGVVLRSRTSGNAASQQLDAWRVEYDAVRSSAKATSLPGGLVVLSDSAQPTPMRAAALDWEIKTGRATVLSPEPVVAPAPGK